MAGSRSTSSATGARRSSGTGAWTQRPARGVHGRPRPHLEGARRPVKSGSPAARSRSSGPMGPTRGRAAVYVDGERVRVVDLRAAHVPPTAGPVRDRAGATLGDAQGGARGARDPGPAARGGGPDRDPALSPRRRLAEEPAPLLRAPARAAVPARRPVRGPGGAVDASRRSISARYRRAVAAVREPQEVARVHPGDLAQRPADVAPEVSTLPRRVAGRRSRRALAVRAAAPGGRRGPAAPAGCRGAAPAGAGGGGTGPPRRGCAYGSYGAGLGGGRRTRGWPGPTRRGGPGRAGSPRRR